MQSQRIPKQMTVTIEGRRKVGRPRKIWRDDVGDGLNTSIMGMHTIQPMYY